MDPSQLFYDVPLGAYPGDDGTVFRIFAPNARKLTVRHGPSPDRPLEEKVEAREIATGLWEATWGDNLADRAYTLSIEPKETFGLSSSAFGAILDPYALACYDASSTAIAVDRRTLPAGSDLRSPPPLADLVLLEGHFRDLLGLDTNAADPPTYGDFSRWLETPENYLESLGINALELQPLQEFDAVDGGEYHWGYMPVNYFAPTRAYATNRAHGTQIEEVAELIRTCHRRGLAVILDVVYNHVGNPNALRALGGDYFFRRDGQGRLTNCSGCGNDLRTEAPMARRLILDSLLHFLRVYDVDGFRFDLAELIDDGTRRAVEATLRRVRPGIILIAEPWSFRGHCALALKETSWSYWNDDFRESLRRYVLGQCGRDALHYFIGGCTAHLTRIPSQSINYTASHDDRCWIDAITENLNFDGTSPLDLDIRRTRLMFCLLFCCLGVPMLAQGQDFLHSKGGICNTYRDGDRNRLRGKRWEKYGELHRYVADWIRFRRSERGKLLRLPTAPSATFFGHFPSTGTATAVLYNAAGEVGPYQLLLLTNPGTTETTFTLRDLPGREHFHPVADIHRFFGGPQPHHLAPIHGLEPVGFELWHGCVQ